jgi:hypothetical protein
MSAINALMTRFNAGEVSKSALARVDVDRIRLTAEQQINWMPRKLGAMTMRPGLGYLGSTKTENNARLLPFVSSITKKALLEFTNTKLRIWVDDAVLTRPSVNSQVDESAFSATGTWALSGSGSFSSVISGGELKLIASALGSEATAKQQVSVASGDRGVLHALRVVVTRGPVQFRVGNTAGGEEWIKETTLRTGTHSLAFTPKTGFTAFHITFSTRQYKREARVTSCSVEAAGAVEITTPYTAPIVTDPTIADQISLIRYAQSADVMFIACRGYQQRRIERRSQNSWSFVLYAPEDGPFLPLPTEKAAFTPTGTTGNIVINSDRSFFRQGHVGAIFRLFQTQENVTATISAANNFTDPIRVTGVKSALRMSETPLKRGGESFEGDEVTGESGDTVGDGRGSQMIDHKLSRTTEAVSAGSSDVELRKQHQGKRQAGTRRFRYSLTKSGTFTCKGVTLQRSFDGPDAGYSDVRTDKPNIGVSLRDEFDNSVVWYRAGVLAANTITGGGSVEVNLNYPHGGGSGIVRITGFNSSTQVTAEVLQPLSSKVATRDWLEGAWSDRQGWPTACFFFGGRLYWTGNDTIWGSVSDAYESFDYEMEGDAAPIIRSIGEGPVQAINSGLPLKRPILFGTGSEIAIRSNSLEEPLTPTNFGLSDISTQGSANVPAVKVDGRAIYVQRSKRRLFQVLYQLDQQDYGSIDLMALHPDLGSDDFVKLAVQRQPETMIHAVRADGTVCCLLLEPAEEVVAWWRIQTDGVIEDVCVLPGTPEDDVYYVVKRTINGVDKRYVEKFARLDECIGGTLTKLADSHLRIVQSSSSTITGLSHLNGKTVVVWAKGKDLGTYTVSSGSITVSEAVATAIVGLPYEATYKSSKLAYAAQKGTALLQKKIIKKLGLLCLNTHYQAVQYGDNFADMTPMPLVEDGVTVAANTINTVYDEPMFPLDGSWDTDSRLCLKCTAPRPATICAAVIGMETRDS